MSRGVKAWIDAPGRAGDDAKLTNKPLKQILSAI